MYIYTHINTRGEMLRKKREQSVKFTAKRQSIEGDVD